MNEPRNGMADENASFQQTSPESPLGFAKEVEALMKLPQHLCKQRGACCRVANFKGLLAEEAVRKLALEDSMNGEMARDFLALFVAYESQEAVAEVAAEFLELAREAAVEKGLNPDEVGFFRCRYVLEDGRCGVHEDRPIGCRTYPLPHGSTLYHPGCGFERRGRENWARIQQILQLLQNKLA